MPQSTLAPGDGASRVLHSGMSALKPAETAGQCAGARYFLFWLPLILNLAPADGQ